MRHVHRIKKEAEPEAQQPKPELRQGELALEGGHAEAPRRADTVTRDTAGMQSPDRDAAPAQHVDTVPPVEAEDYPAHAAAAQENVPPLRPDLDPPKPDWYAPCEALQRDWNELIERVQQTGEPLSRRCKPSSTSCARRGASCRRRSTAARASGRRSRAPGASAASSAAPPGTGAPSAPASGRRRNVATRRRMRAYVRVAASPMPPTASGAPLSSRSMSRLTRTLSSGRAGAGPASAPPRRGM